MSGIICAIRGGPASQPTIARAIALAQETGLPLTFLYVVDLDFLRHATGTHIHTIAHEMQQMGEFILLAAQATAGAQQVEAQREVRQGRLVEVVAALCRELQADYVVVGRPQVRPEESVFTHDRLEQFAENIQAATGARVVVTEAGET